MRKEPVVLSGKVDNERGMDELVDGVSNWSLMENSDELELGMIWAHSVSRREEEAVTYSPAWIYWWVRSYPVESTS